MDFGFSEYQEMLKTMARDFLEKECPVSLVRDMEEDEKGYSPDLWRKMADLGWLGLILPEKYGGSDGSFVDAIILIEEMGRALLPAPFLTTVVLGALPVLSAGTEEQKEEILPGIAGGEVILTMALTEPTAGYDAESIKVRAESDGNDYIINGTKLFIPDAHVANYLLCVARTGKEDTGEKGITLFLVDTTSPGIKCTQLKTMASDRQCEVTFDNVTVPRKNILGKLDEGWTIVEKTLKQAAIAECAFMLGAARRVWEMTIDYVMGRIQYGKPIGSFQAVQHRCVDMSSDVEGAKYITYQAAWRLSQDLPCNKEVSMAKAWVNKACSRTSTQACYLHGAIGYTQEHDAQLYMRRVKAAEFAFGDTAFHQEIVARELNIQ